MFSKKKLYFIIIVILLFIISNGWSAQFLPQKDSYFGYRKTDIYWKMAFGINIGTSYKEGTEISSVNRNVELRTIGGITPNRSLISYFYNSFNINYNLYNDVNLANKSEIIIFNLIYGIGFKINKNLSLYTGAGGGVVLNMDRFNVNASNPDEILFIFNIGKSYIGNIGLEYKISKLLSFFIDNKILYNVWEDNSHYIPDKYKHYEGNNFGDNYYKIIDDGDSFKLVKVNRVQFNFSIGIRFYWGENMFWWFGWWEKN